MLVINVREGDYVKVGESIFKVTKCPKSSGRARLTIVTDCKVARASRVVCEDDDGKFFFFPDSPEQEENILRVLAKRGDL